MAWDAEEKQWYSLYPDEATPPGDVLDWQSDRLSWNYMCAACHTTGLERGYDVDTDSYETTWAEYTVGCEACHGPGSDHARDPASGYGMTGSSETLLPARGRASMSVLENEMTMCAACHSRRTPLVEPAVVGESFLDQYAPALIRDGLYFDDGQIQDEVYVYGSYLQSGMARAGVTCTDCHDPHTGLTTPARGCALPLVPRRKCRAGAGARSAFDGRCCCFVRDLPYARAHVHGH